MEGFWSLCLPLKIWGEDRIDLIEITPALYPRLYLLREWERFVYLASLVRILRNIELECCLGMKGVMVDSKALFSLSLKEKMLV